MTGTLHETNIYFLSHFDHFFLRMRNVSDKSCRENQNTHFMINNVVIEDLAVYEVIWKNIVERSRP